ncbi:hypothetical protein C7999DRAFT_27284 [Corynascus novoguineensis]|uniref:GRIP domain-containing protein n=1 Tax=Corynascus novoguineensis TaxID=1126955 RepID=A0AAN7D109_9PEZI|nr:hypothetical protein C7999DRAFT_27284 [Corynascus novoguineensis]
MSSPAAPTSSIQSAARGSAANPNNKKKGNKKRKGNKSNTAAANTTAGDATSSVQNPPAAKPDISGENNGVEGETIEEVSEELENLDSSTPNTPPEVDHAPDKPETIARAPETEEDVETTVETEATIEDDSEPVPANGHASTNGHSPTISGARRSATRPETMPEDHDALRLEVEQLRKQLENTQESHAQEVAQLRSDLEEAEAAREQAETQYQTLLGRVEKIRETLGDRLKRDKAELEETKDRLEELEAQNEELQNTLAAREEEAERLRDEVQEQGRELASLRSRTNLSQQNRLKEKDEMSRQLQNLKSELESTTAAMGEWEVIAMEERSLREALADKVSDLEEQVASAREAFERADADRDSQSQAVDRLQRALQELQDTRKRELREMVESTEEQVQALKKVAHEANARAADAESAKEALSKELERTAPFEKEVKEKNLLIGKLRHEAIVLNDHLTKALKYIKKTKPEETIDKQLVTNHFLQFLTLDRSDPKKFQILQVMANLLNWTDEQREKAGLARPGGGGGAAGGGGGSSASNTLRLPTSPFHRTPSSPALNTEFFSELSAPSASAAGGGVGGKESLADLWASFLEQSVEEAAAGGKGGSRKDSMASVSTAGGGRPDTRGG